VDLAAGDAALAELASCSGTAISAESVSEEANARAKLLANLLLDLMVLRLTFFRLSVFDQ
jgi:hypothetical protein